MKTTSFGVSSSRNCAIPTKYDGTLLLPHNNNNHKDHSKIMQLRTLAKSLLVLLHFTFNKINKTFAVNNWQCEKTKIGLVNDDNKTSTFYLHAKINKGKV